MPSPDVNRVRIIGEELLPELQCPQDPLPEKLKVLLELLDAAEWRYRHTRERQGPVSDDLRIRGGGRGPQGHLAGNELCREVLQIGKSALLQRVSDAGRSPFVIEPGGVRWQSLDDGERKGARPGVD